MDLTNNQQLAIDNLLPRPPIVVVLGHVDHGKTTLLSKIRQSAMPKEPGEITQSIGAYEITHNGKKITFIDTPGHEAFFKMRERGAKVADLAILVVAADDGVKSQTLESIKILTETKTAFIVAINKIDKPNADVEKTKNDLTANGVLLEGYGGNVSWQAISAKSGQGINELLDLILLAAEMENLTYNLKEKAVGVIIETKTDPHLGNLAIAIVKNGALKIGDKIATSSAIGKIKVLKNFLNESVNELLPSAPAIISEFETLPKVGEEFSVGKDIETKTPSFALPRTERKPLKELAAFNLILKADVSGSLETLSEIIKNLKYENVSLNILDEGVGEITDGDVKAAAPTKAIIIGFKTRLTKIAQNLARAQNIKIITSEIIYELIEAIEKEIKLTEKPPALGELEILKVFSQKGKKQLIGGKVVSGIIKKNSRLKIIRGSEELGLGKIIGLKHLKTEITEAKENEECGVMFESEISINEGDHLIWLR